MIQSLLKFIKIILLIIWIVILIFLGAGLSYKNPELVDIDLVLFAFEQKSLGLVLTLTLFTGLILGIALMLPKSLMQYWKLRKSKKTIEQQIEPGQEPSSQKKLTGTART